MRRWLVIVITVVLIPLSAHAEEISLNLDEALALGLRDNRDVLLKAEDVNDAKFALAEANAGLFPTATVTSTWSRTYNYYNKDVTQTTAQATLKQYLYQGGKVINTIKYSGHKIEVAQALLEKEKLELALSIRTAFYTLLLAREYQGLNQAIVENTRKHLESLKERYMSGEASESDILNTENSLASVEQVLESSANQVEASQELLRNLLYLGNDVSILPQEELKAEAKDLAYDSALLKASANRPEIRQYEAQEKADKRSIEIAKAGNRPSIYVSWDYYLRTHAASTAGVYRDTRDYSISGLTVSWPIFDGWATKAKVEQAIVGLKQTQLTKQQALKDIAKELKDAYLALKDAIALTLSAQSEEMQYSDNLRKAEERYQQGLVSELDREDAQVKYSIALFAQKQAVYDYLIAKADFEKATGGI